MASSAENQIPLIALADSNSLLSIERTVIRLIVDRGGYLAAKAAELQRELTQIELDGGGLEMMADLLTRFSEQPILFLKDEGTAIAAAGTGGVDRTAQEACADLFAQPDNTAKLACSQIWYRVVREQRIDRHPPH